MIVGRGEDAGGGRVVSTLSGGSVHEVPQEAAEHLRVLHVVKLLGDEGPRAIPGDDVNALSTNDDGEEVRAGLVVEDGNGGEPFENALVLIRGALECGVVVKWIQNVLYRWLYGLCLPIACIWIKDDAQRTIGLLTKDLQTLLEDPSSLNLNGV